MALKNSLRGPRADLPRPGRERSYWVREALAAEGDARPSVRPSREAHYDVVIVGGGYTGLWTAYFLTERDPAIRLCIVEQDVCGGGPSGRNGGFLHGWWDQLPLLEELFGAESAVELAREADEAVAGTAEFCERHGVDAWYHRAGYMRVSASKAQDDDWRAAVDACERLGVADQYHALTPDEVQRRCASPTFRGGALMPNAATIQPARLARGLRRVLLERGVEIFEHTRVERLDIGVRIRAETPWAPLYGDQAVVAVNAWARTWPEFSSSLIAWGSYIALTAPAPRVVDELGWRGEAITDSRFTVHYFRTTPDGRVAFGAGVGPTARSRRSDGPFERDRRAVERTVAGLRRLLPALADVPVTEAWGGPIDVSSDRLPLIGSRHGGRVHYAHGYSGNGVGPARLAGRLLAARIAGSSDRLAALPIIDRRTQRFPPEPIRSLGARIVRHALIRHDELADMGRPSGRVVRELTRLPRRLGYRLGPHLRQDK